jgi:cobalamin biosynthesis Mg chelatase CobN
VVAIGPVQAEGEGGAAPQSSPTRGRAASEPAPRIDERREERPRPEPVDPLVASAAEASPGSAPPAATASAPLPSAKSAPGRTDGFAVEERALRAAPVESSARAPSKKRRRPALVAALVGLVVVCACIWFFTKSSRAAQAKGTATSSDVGAAGSGGDPAQAPAPSSELSGAGH